MVTQYSEAWRKFRASKIFRKIVDRIDEARGVYLENRIREAFDAGWNAKTSSILEVLSSTAKKK